MTLGALPDNTKDDLEGIQPGIRSDWVSHGQI
jgi:hypothetical protein